MPHITVVECGAVTLGWLRVTLVVKRAHIFFFKEENTVPGRIVNFLAVMLLWLSFKRKLEFPEEGSNHSEGPPLLSGP